MPTLHKNNSDLDFLVAVLQPWEAVGFYGNMGTQGGGWAVEAPPPLKDAKNMSSVAYRTYGIDGEKNVDEELIGASGSHQSGGAELYVGQVSAYRMRAFGDYADDDTASTVKERDYKDNTDLVLSPRMGVRRLLPVETERLQGFEDGWTEGQADTSRYKQMGNAVSVAVTSWLGWRIKRYAELQD